MTEQIYAVIENTLADLTERPVQGLEGTMRFGHDIDLDSYMFVQFLLALEKRVPGLRFKPETLCQVELSTVSHLVTYIMENTSSAPQD